MTRIFLSALLLFPAILSAQLHFDKEKSKVKKELEHFISRNKSINPSLNETDSTLVLQTEDKPGQFIRVIYGFDRVSAKCNVQQTVTDCDACYQEQLNKLMEQKSFQWKKLNENQYASRYEDHLLLELRSEENDFTFTLFRTDWSREFYELLIKE